MMPKRASLLVISFCLASLIIVATFTQKSYAVTASSWMAGNIIDDVIFTDKDAMSVEQIQTFLNNKVGTGTNGVPGQCDTNGARMSEWNSYTITRAEYAINVGKPGPFTCLKDFYEVPKTVPGPEIPANNYGGKEIPAGAKSAAQLIWDAAQTHNISPKVLLVKLGTESAGPLTSDDWPFLSQYTYAMGAHCPDSGPGGSANCDINYSGFSIQISEAASLLRWYLDSMDESWWPYKKPYQTNSILWNIVESGCGSYNVFIENKATAALYTYTPYQPNPAALSNMYGKGDGCSAYGNRNFWRTFNDWFGSTYAYVYNGVSYSAVFDADYYLNNYPDLKLAFEGNVHSAFEHFVVNGMNEGRQASENFNVTSYRNRYPDLRRSYGTNLLAYYMHYITNGGNEGRIATGDTPIVYIADYNGIDYSAVYDFNTYISNYTDLYANFSNDDMGAIAHFVNSGMREGRQASADFSVTSYRNRYPDLRVAYGNNLPAYYQHYINRGKNEGRVAIGNELNGTTAFNGIDYSAVYDFNTYISNYTDLYANFSNDDMGAIAHFVNSGMREGRQANNLFNVYSYKNQYYDLRYAFGQDLKQYYLHYMYSGKKEGRFANGTGFNAIPSTRNGIDYSAVYDFNFYTKNNPDVFAAFGYDDVTTLTHFIQSGMKEGRQASESFNVINYKNRYPDLQQAFGNDLAIYHIHYIYSGLSEGRIGY